jgi:hypothetical protein
VIFELIDASLRAFLLLSLYSTRLQQQIDQRLKQRLRLVLNRRASRIDLEAQCQLL